MLAEKLRHLLGALQAALAVREEQWRSIAVRLGSLLQGDAEADRRHDVLEASAILRCVVDVVRGDAAQPERSRRLPKRLVAWSLAEEVTVHLDEEVVCPETVAVGGEARGDVGFWPN